MSGFSAKMFEEKVDEKYKCPICLYILQDPMQTPICGHIFCRSCIATSIRYLHLLPALIRQTFSTVFIRQVS